MRIILSMFLLVLSFALHAMKQYSSAEDNIGTINFQFESIENNQLISKTMPIFFPSLSDKQTVYTNAPDMHKTVLAIEMGNLITTALNEFHACAEASDNPKANIISERVVALASSIEKKLELLGTKKKLPKFYKMIAVIKKLAKNISEHGKSDSPTILRSTGGAKGIERFRRIVQEGYVPKLEDFCMESFMSEFAQPIAWSGGNDEFPSVKPTTAFDPTTNTFYVQLNLSASDKRKPLNVVFVVDISNSMTVNDGTPRSRLEWAKQAMRDAIDSMNDDDRVSIVAFDDEVITILDPTYVNAENKDRIINSYANLEPRGANDLHIGLERGFSLVTKYKNSKLANTVILISDAGMDTGDSSKNELFDLLSTNAHAAEPIGLIAIAVGLHSDKQLIDRIRMSKDSNYLFAQSGEEMANLFEKFAYLVTPVAYNFRAKVMLNVDLKAKLIRTYGIPMTDQELFVRTLFLAGTNGGAMVLLYHLEN